jgi:hypothetical protein
MNVLLERLTFEVSVSRDDPEVDTLVDKLADDPVVEKLTEDLASALAEYGTVKVSR